MPDASRWPALFQDAQDAIFVLDRRRKLIFANPAWEKLTGQPFAALHGMTCTRRQTGADHAALASVLAPPPEVLDGQSARVQRPLPHAKTGPPWWEIDFLPIRSESEVTGIVGRMNGPGPSSAVTRALTEAEAALRQAVADRHRLESIESRHPSLQAALAQSRLAVQARCGVLIVGEPGTGKQWFARAIHHGSAARDRPFLTLDVAALPTMAVNGVLFGPLGLYRSDGAGTIYIHEPSRLSLDVQDEVAQRLADGALTGPRLIAGTTLVDDPAQSIAQGAMLRPLFDALSVIVIRLPAVRERIAELPALAEQMLARLSSKPLTIAPDALEALAAHTWPGNLTELQFVLQSAIVQTTSGDRVEVNHLPLAIRQSRLAADLPPPAPEAMPPLDAALEQLERKLIRSALEKAKGNRARAAELLSIWRSRLIRRMKALGIDQSEPDV
jgi:DNA-binding NtrC family response regulator